MRKIFILPLIIAAALTFVPSYLFAAGENLDIRILDAKKLFSEFSVDTEKGIPQEEIAKSKAIIIFPTLIKAGFLYAGRYGVGIAMARDEATGKWSPPAFVRISGGSFGLQAGINSTDLILIGRDTFDLRNLLNGGPTVSATATATAGIWGVHSELGTGWELNSNAHWYSRNKGLFADNGNRPDVDRCDRKLRTTSPRPKRTLRHLFLVSEHHLK